MTEPDSLSPELGAALAAYAAGEISGEIALMRLLLALGEPEVAYERALFGERGSGLPVQSLEPLFPKRH